MKIKKILIFSNSKIWISTKIRKVKIWTPKKPQRFPNQSITWRPQRLPALKWEKLSQKSKPKEFLLLRYKLAHKSHQLQICGHLRREDSQLEQARETSFVKTWTQLRLVDTPSFQLRLRKCHRESGIELLQTILLNQIDKWLRFYRI